MNKGLADKLISSKSYDAFLSEQGGGLQWQTMAALKGEVDRLIGCDLKAAADLAGRIEGLAEHAGDEVSKAFARASRARVLHSSGHHAQANDMYRSALAAMRAARLTSEAATVLIHQVYALTQLGQYQEALHSARSARRMLVGGDPLKIAQLETNVGTVYYMLDRYKQALKHYDRAHELLSTRGDEATRAYVDFSRSNIFAELDRPGEAQALLEQAAGAWEKAGRSLLAAQARFQIAYLEFLRGNYNAALASYYRARDRVVELGSSPLAAWCDLEIAEILLALNAFDDAAAGAASASARFGALGLPYELAKATLVRGLAAMGLEQFEQAQSHLAEAREAFQASGNRTFTALTDTYLAELAMRRSDPAEAARRAAAALRVFAQQKLSSRAAHSRLIAARAAYRAGQLAKASRMARATLKAVEALFAPAVVYQCHHLVGLIERDRGRKRLALASFRKAVDTIEQMRGGVAADEFKATFLRDKIEVYEMAIAACLDEGSPALIEEAFRLVESSKSRALADLLARYAVSPETGSGGRKQGISETLRARLAQLLEELNWYKAQAGLENDKGEQRNAQAADRYRQRVVRSERQVADLFRRIEVEDPAFAFMHRMQPASVADLLGTLEADEAAVEYFTTADEISAFVAARDGLQVIRAIASKRELEQKLAAARFQIEKFGYGRDYIDTHFWQLKQTTDESLAALYEALFAPLEAALASKRLIIIPHDVLHYVPFHALCDRRGYYLIDRFEISYAPSAAVLKLCRARPGPVQDSHLVAVGVAERGTPAIEDEVAALGSLFPDAVTLMGSEATRSNLMRRAPQARFLHLASHGYFRRDNPMFSFLKLADSRLDFYSLLDLKLNAELVTLSACHTGINRVFPGDELHGLVRGFLYAGAPALIVSLWAVNDRSTAELMREMYSHIRAGASKREALRRAQLTVKEAYGHPYYWAPFVLMGNPG